MRSMSCSRISSAVESMLSLATCDRFPLRDLYWKEHCLGRSHQWIKQNRKHPANTETLSVVLAGCWICTESRDYERPLFQALPCCHVGEKVHMGVMGTERDLQWKQDWGCGSSGPLTWRPFTPCQVLPCFSLIQWTLCFTRVQFGASLCINVPQWVLYINNVCFKKI